ncbi:hypothetical protein C4572_00305 [Candidatus Parcubacteria bacterium]|nr:MAG: hypothetical protein C4572_00305 [Candidatus Parcubacteria bacterium]
MENKTIKIIIGALILVTLLFLGFVFYVSRPVSEQDDEGGKTEITFPETGDNAGTRRSSSSRSRIGSISSQKENRLTQLTQESVSGAAFYGTTTALYMERATGHIYKISLKGEEKIRLSNTTIPKSFEAFWSPKSDNLVVRYFDDPPQGQIKLRVKTFLISAGHLLKATTTGEVKGVATPSSISEITVSPSEDKIFYLNRLEDSVEGIVADFSNKNQKKIFELAFGEFNLHWPAKDQIFLLTKPSSRTEGYLYSLDQRTGALARVLGGIKGMTALVSPAGDKVVFSQTANNVLESGVYDAKEKNFSKLGFATLADKCVWSGKGQQTGKFLYCAVPDGAVSSDLPDGWYQGAVSFSDSVWSKNLATGETKKIFDTPRLDVVDPQLSADESYLIFTNKNDGTLWSLRL